MARPTFDESLQTEAPEKAWLEHLHAVSVDKDGELQERPVTYSGFFSHLQNADVRSRDTVGILPIFYEKASSVATQKHAILVAKKATDFINPGQVPVIVGDCPLYVQQKSSGSTVMKLVNRRCVLWVSSTLRWHPKNVGGSCWLDLDGNGCFPMQRSSRLVLQHLF